MPFRYFHSDRLSSLFPIMRAQLRDERRIYPPQKTQVIIVGNLETEAWITRQFLAVDGVLMGVKFPFLESAIRCFSERLRFGLKPRAGESWFLPSVETKDLPRPISVAEFEIVLLGLLQDPEKREILYDLGYDTNLLTPAQITALAGQLTNELRESILHCPRILSDALTEEKKPQSAGIKLWRAVHAILIAMQRPFPAFDPGLADWIAAQRADSAAERETLYLFGMPILSEYHVRSLAAIAKHQSVHLYMTDLSDFARSENLLLSTAGRKSAAFAAHLQAICAEYGTEFSASGVPSKALENRSFAVYALPGIWRAAELIGDDFHRLLKNDSALYQNDIAVSLTDPSSQYAAFERALAMRQMTAFSRERFYEVPHRLAELWQIISDSVASGLSRALLVRYALHPLVAGQDEQKKEKIRLWLAALEKCHGYRDDYPESQSVYKIEEALRRLERGMLIGNRLETGVPGAYSLRLFDSQTVISDLRNFLRPLLEAKIRLSGLCGIQLAEAMQILQREITGTGESLRTLTDWFEQTKYTPGFASLTLPHVVKILKRHLPRTSLAQQTGREGVTFSTLGASCFTHDTELLFDLNEDADRAEPPKDQLFPEILQSVTRFSGYEQLAIQLSTALVSDARRVIFAYCNFDPATGAEKYPSQILASLPEAARLVGRLEEKTAAFPATMLDSNENHLPLAADGDRRTLWLLKQARKPALLSQYTLPAQQIDSRASIIEVRELHSYLQNPARHLLKRYLPRDLELASFKREEPRIAVSSDARLRFCEDYLEYSLLNAADAEPVSPKEFVQFKKARGEYAPDGFDQASLLLESGDNHRRLAQLADEIRTSYRLVEFLLQDNISSSFSVQETPRLSRYYYPAPVVSGRPITGSLGILLQSADGKLYRLQSAIYAERNAAIVSLHLLCCLLVASNTGHHGLSLADFATKTQSKDPMAALVFTPRAGIRIPDAKYALTYLEKLTSDLDKQQVTWYDHFLIQEPQLSAWTDFSARDVLQKFRQQTEKDLGNELKRLQQFFALEVNERSIEFFDSFIRPVAQLDREQNASEKKSALSNKKRTAAVKNRASLQ